MADSETPKTDKKGKRNQMPIRHTARVWTLQYLYQLDVSGEEFSESTLEWFWRQVEEDCPEFKRREIEKTRALTLELARGVLEHKDAVDEVIDEFSKGWDIDRIATVDRNILRISAYEICHTDLPVAVSIDEALEICRAFGGGEDARKFINGILDQIYKKAKKGADE